MRMSTWDRLAPFSGLATVILWAAGFFVIESGNTPEEGTPAEALAYFEDDRMTIYLGASLVMAGALFLIWFAATLREAVVARSPESARLGSVVFGGGLATAICALALPTSQVGGAFAGESDAALDPAAAQALWYGSDGFFVATMYGAALFVIATAVAILRTRMFPVWLAWASILLGIWLLLSFIGWLALIFVFPVWLILVGVLLWRQLNAPATPSPATATPLE